MLENRGPSQEIECGGLGMIAYVRFESMHWMIWVQLQALWLVVGISLHRGYDVHKFTETLNTRRSQGRKFQDEQTCPLHEKQ